MLVVLCTCRRVSRHYHTWRHDNQYYQRESYFRYIATTGPDVDMVQVDHLFMNLMNMFFVHTQMSAKVLLIYGLR
jgi:hypothetical protein